MSVTGTSSGSFTGSKSAASEATPKCSDGLSAICSMRMREVVGRQNEAAWEIWSVGAADEKSWAYADLTPAGLPFGCSYLGVEIDDLSGEPDYVSILLSFRDELELEVKSVAPEQFNRVIANARELDQER